MSGVMVGLDIGALSYDEKEKKVLTYKSFVGTIGDIAYESVRFFDKMKLYHFRNPLGMDRYILTDEPCCGHDLLHDIRMSMNFCGHNNQFFTIRVYCNECEKEYDISGTLLDTAIIELGDCCERSR